MSYKRSQLALAQSPSLKFLLATNRPIIATNLYFFIVNISSKTYFQLLVILKNSNKSVRRLFLIRPLGV
ncbi:MAG: hypothetical protein ACJA1B_002303 [Polaribacter sp.]|jgi:hypothetical protein